MKKTQACKLFIDTNRLFFSPQICKMQVFSNANIIYEEEKG